MASSTQGAPARLSPKGLKLLTAIRKSQLKGNPDPAALRELQAFGLVASVLRSEGTTFTLTHKGLEAYKQQVER